MKRPEGEHFKQRNDFPDSVTVLLRDGPGCGVERQQGLRTTNHGKRHEDFIPSAVEDINGIP